MTNFTPTDPKLFFSKNDARDIRLGDLFKPLSDIKTLGSNSFCILGYPDDEGIKLNSGRGGAALAPPAIRQYLYKMTPSFVKSDFFDMGDLIIEFDLAHRHLTALNTVYDLHLQAAKTISLGGGHDYAYSDVSGFLKASISKGQRPLVLNFDAHLDVRPSEQNLNSGTPFYRLLNEFHNQFDFAEIGIQPQCNSIQHRDWALSKKALIFNLKNIQLNNGLMSLFSHPLFNNLSKTTPVFISFDIDGLSSTEAPGCSQSWVTGLTTQDYLNFFLSLAKKSDVRGLGIYEVSPPLDFDNQTSKTAALIAYNFLFQDSP